MMKKINQSFLITFLAIFFVSGCSISPGVHIETQSSWIDQKEYVYIPSIDKKVYIKSLSNIPKSIDKYRYRIGAGDLLTYQVWGLPEIFPLSNNRESNIRRIDSNGEMFFPYVGNIIAAGKTPDELRIDLAYGLSKYFKDPQIDISVLEYNSQKAYVLGEVNKPQRINLTDVPISLSDAIGYVSGLNNTTSNSTEIYIIRGNSKVEILPSIYKADLSSPNGFIEASNFYLEDNDVVYVNAKGTTRWNKVVSQFFPFSSFLNSVDRLLESD